MDGSNTHSNSVMNNIVQQNTPIAKRSKHNNKKGNHNKNKNKSKNINNHIKVVYISNPMKVKTSASEFRALVQELTGQYSELPPDPSKFQDFGCGDDDGGSGGEEIGNHQLESENCVVNRVGHSDDEHRGTLVVPPPVDPNSGGSSNSMEGFEPFDDVFTPLMIENISSLLPSSVFYDSTQQVDQVVMQCNYVHP